jgi:hypothetical protein
VASEAFIECKPFDRLFKMLRLGDTATNLGNAMDQLMRHQLLEEVRGVVVVVMIVISGVDGSGAGGDSDSDAPRCAPWAGTPALCAGNQWAGRTRRLAIRSAAQTTSRSTAPAETRRRRRWEPRAARWSPCPAPAGPVARA